MTHHQLQPPQLCRGVSFSSWPITLNIRGSKTACVSVSQLAATVSTTFLKLLCKISNCIITLMVRGTKSDSRHYGATQKVCTVQYIQVVLNKYYPLPPLRKGSASWKMSGQETRQLLSRCQHTHMHIQYTCIQTHTSAPRCNSNSLA